MIKIQDRNTAIKEIRLRTFMREGVVEAGCDEAGRGPLAGPVFAAAVILPPDFHHPLLNDSKQMNTEAREELRAIIEAEAVAWAVEAVSAAEIDKINILNASIAAMQRAVMALGTVPQHLLIDGNRFRSFSYIQHLSLCDPESELFSDAVGKPGPVSNSEVSSEMKIGVPEGSSLDSEVVPENGTFETYDALPYTCVVKGDAKFTAIAAASILAKTHRDAYMRRLALDYPEYGWERNMGYPTPEHLSAIRLHGLTPHHRLSFRAKNLEK